MYHNYNNIKADDPESLSILLPRLCDPRQFSHLILRIVSTTPQLFIFYQTLDLMLENWGYLLETLA